jgi:hypothetical protein
MGCQRRNQYLALGAIARLRGDGLLHFLNKDAAIVSKMDGPHRCATLWKAECKQQIVRSRTTVTQDREGKLSRGV